MGWCSRSAVPATLEIGETGHLYLLYRWLHPDRKLRLGTALKLVAHVVPMLAAYLNCGHRSRRHTPSLALLDAGDPGPRPSKPSIPSPPTVSEDAAFLRLSAAWK